MTKVLKTDKSRNEAIDRLQKQITALTQNLSKSESDENEPIAQIIKEKQYQLEVLQNKREWLYNFESGGWNSTTAFTEEEAIRNAKKEWEDSDNLIIDEDSFRIKTEADYKNLLSLFY